MSTRSVTPFQGRAVADYVFIENLSFHAVVGPDAWGREGKAQQVLVSVKWYNDISGKDDLTSTLSYSKMSKDITEAITSHGKGFKSAQGLMDLILFVVVDKQWGGLALEIEIHLPKALLQAEGGLRYLRGYTPNEQSIDRLPFPRHKLYPYAIVEDMHVHCIIGVNPHERDTKQMVKVALSIEEDLTALKPEGIQSHWQETVKKAKEMVESSEYQTVEALATDLANTLLASSPAQRITVSVSKPSAQAFVGGSGASVTRYKA